MKVALLLYGQPRFIDNLEVETTYKNVIINRYDTDVFCHLWWSDCQSKFNCSTWSGLDDCLVHPNTLEIIKNKYSPLVLEYNASRTFEFSPTVKRFMDYKFTDKHCSGGDFFNDKNYSNVISQLWSIQRVSELFDNFKTTTNTYYDWIIHARYDSVLINFPNLEDCDPNRFYLPGHHNKFPDNIQFFGYKFITWAKNIFNDIDDVFEDVWEPIPEAFKGKSFERRFSMSDLNPCSVNIIPIRS